MAKAAPVNARPLLELKKVSRHYTSGDTLIKALDEVSLTVYPGEFVAIMGQSGSGKSTLMNIIGCLDKPSGGTYLAQGKDVANFVADELARLRRETFGFIFQRYNLLATATAQENVEIPAIYAGMDRPGRMARAVELLKKLGLGERGDHRPSQLSGGQQQRVAIARSLVNNPPVILADEPTGALDSRSGKEVMALLHQLHEEGRTIILITHDEHVAANAKRLIKIQDGKIISDEVVDASTVKGPLIPHGTDTEETVIPELGEATKMALRSLKVNMFRTALTLLGIIIGVASVVTMMAVGNGSKQNVVDQISAMGTNLLSIRPGAADIRSTGDIATMTPADADAIGELPNVDNVSAERSSHYTVRYGHTDYATTVSGESAGFTQVRGWTMAEGSFFTDRDVKSYAPVVVLGQTVVTSLFGPDVNPVGEQILIQNVPFEVIGVFAPKGASIMGTDQDDVAVIPITTGLVRLFGRAYVNSIAVKVDDLAQIDATQDAITKLLTDRHRVEDFSIRNMASLLDMASSTQNTLTILLGTVAAISLLVGGIGVMNIMLVSVTERTREIGVRMATGARRNDILLQFITEASVVCIIGGVLGVALGFGLGLVLMAFDVKVLFTSAPAILAFGSAFGTGLLFGYIPARKAAEMDPVVALATE